jgi:hypothetical protein
LQMSAQVVAVRELSQSPERFVDQRVRVIAYVVPDYGVSAAFEPAGKFMVHLLWRNLNIEHCVRRKFVVVEGMFRVLPTTRWKYGLLAETMRELDQDASADAGASAPPNPLIPPDGEIAVFDGGRQP